MNKKELNEYIANEIALADANVSLFVKDMDTGETLYAYHENEAVSSASTIKVPIMLAALEQVRRGALTLEQRIPVNECEILDDTEVFEYGTCDCPLNELIYWMIVKSDNTSTNVLIETLGFAAINDMIHALGMKSTVLGRKMLDFEALKAGRNNLISAYDMALCYEALHRGTVLTPELCAFALGILKRQRSMNMFLRYIADDIEVAHKTGALDPDLGHDRVAHDAGIFYLDNVRYYLGIFLTGAPDDKKYSRRLIGRLSKAVYEYSRGD